MDLTSYMIICTLWTSMVCGAPTLEIEQEEQPPPQQQPPPISVQYQAQNKDGHYKFGYATQDGQYRVEEGSSSDVVIGSYGYPSPDGRYIRVFYKADKNGFQILTPPDGEGANTVGQAQPLGFPKLSNYDSAQSQLHSFLPDVSMLTTPTSTTTTAPTTTTSTATTQEPTTPATTTTQASIAEAQVQDQDFPNTDDFPHNFPLFHHYPPLLPPPPPPVMFLQPSRRSGRRMLIFYPPPPVSIPPLHYMAPRLRYLRSLVPFRPARFPNFHKAQIIV